MTGIPMEISVYSRQKNPREIDQEYINFLKSQSCASCGAPSKNPHHTITRGAGGSDYFAVPVCFNCHFRVHSQGYSHWENVNVGQLARLPCIVLAVIIKQLVSYIKKKKGGE
jgi:hypothetical protein